MVMLRALFVAVLLSGCATGYQDQSNPVLGMFGGYWESKGPGKLIKVGFNGNAFIERTRVGSFLLYRCAEIAQREGRSHFLMYSTLPDAIRDRRSSERTVNTIGGKPAGYVYMLLSSESSPGAHEVKEVLTRLAPEIKGSGKS